MNKTLYYDNKINQHLSPQQGVIPEFEEHMPPGCVMAYVANRSPTGWLICNGAAVSRRDYWSLFEVIGTQFGSGDGVNTFNIPDYRGAFLRGAGNGSGSHGYSGPDLNEYQNHATQRHSHDASSNVIDPGHVHTQNSLNDDFNNQNNVGPNGNYTLVGTGIDRTGTKPSFPPSDSAGNVRWSNINSSETGVTVETIIKPSITNGTTYVDADETRPYNFGINWIIKT